MKKTLAATLALTVAGSASAQSSITLFGVVDAAVSGYSNRSEDRNGASLAAPFYVNQGSVKLSRTALTNSGYNSSRLGFRGTEDLGGGLGAGFWLEAPITNDDGATGVSTFSRRSTVSLLGGFGEIRLGRDYTPTFTNNNNFDPFGTNGVGTNLIQTAISTNLAAGGAGGFAGNTSPIRASNAIGYFLPPSLGGVYGQLMYVFHEQNKYDPGTATPNAANSARTGRYAGGRLGYANGPLDVAVAYGSHVTGDQYQAGTTDSLRILNLGASYDFGLLKLFGELSRARQVRDYEVSPVVAAPDVDLSGFLLGVTAPVGPGLIRASYSRVRYDLNRVVLPLADPKASKLALGYVHNLSKRTALYATIARISNKNGAILTVGGPAFIGNATFTPGNSTGYDLGIRHAF